MTDEYTQRQHKNSANASLLQCNRKRIRSEAAYDQLLRNNSNINSEQA